MAVEIVRREDWGASVDRWLWNKFTSSKPVKMRFPVEELWVHHSVSRATGDPAADMRAVESTGIQRFGRLSYSYGIHPNGTILQGEGDWLGTHTLNRNEKSLGVVWLGNYHPPEQSSPAIQPTEAAIDSFVALVHHLVESGRLVPGPTYPTGGHRDVVNTRCPGDNLYAFIGELQARVAAHPDQEDDMPTADEIANAVWARQIDLPVGGVQPAWAALRFIVQDANTAAASAAKLLQRDGIDEKAVAEALAPLLLASMSTLSDEDVRRIADAAADELERRADDDND